MTNDKEFAGAVDRAAARKAAEDALPVEDKAFLESLRQRWFPMGKMEDYSLVKRMLLEAWAK